MSFRPGLTTQWFAIAAQRTDIWAALMLSLRVAAVATLLALVLGTCAAAALARARFFGRETISLLFVLPIALPGIITGIALRSAFNIMDFDFHSGRSCSATPPSASWWSITTRSPDCGGPRLT